MFRYKKPVFWTAAAVALLIVAVAVCFLFAPERSVKDLLRPGTDWVCSTYQISFAVDEQGVAEGTVIYDGEEKDICVGYRFTGRDGIIEIFSGNWAYAQSSGEEPLLSGRCTVQDGALILSVDNVGEGLFSDWFRFFSPETFRFVRSDTFLDELKALCPEFFGLDQAKGLDVIVWQMAEGSYDFGLLPHSDEPRWWLSSELAELPGVNAKQMRTILATYDLDEVDIYIIPWQNPLSSYITDPFLINEGENQGEKLENYIAFIESLLFVDSPTE